VSGSYTLYGGKISYFTGKARAYMLWKGVPFEERVASREVYRDIIVPRVGWPVIPVVVTPEDETWQDTTDIIDRFEERLGGPSVYPDGTRQKLAALLLDIFGDEWLKLPAMHYRWNKNHDWIVLQFGKISRPDLPEAEQRAVGLENAKRFHGSLPFLGISEATHAAIETSYEGLMAELDAHFAMHPYLFGTRPSVGDFGLIGPLFAHQYNDRASGEIMKRAAPNLVAWVKRMQAPETPLAGEFLPDDEIPETLKPLLARVMREYLPVLIDTARAFNAWAAEHPGEDIPRAIGTQPFRLEGATGERAIFVYDLWLLQRVLDHLAALDADERTAARDLLGEVGGLALLDFPGFPRLASRDFKLVYA